jgi:hypothetical protein
VTGVAAAGATPDALLVFLNFWLGLGFEQTREVDGYPGLTWPEPGGYISWGQKKFHKALRAALAPAGSAWADELSAIQGEIFPYRNRALHRDGLRARRGLPGAPWVFESTRYVHPVVADDKSYVTPALGQEYPTGDEPPIADFLDAWAERLDLIIRQLLPLVEPMGSPDDRQPPLSVS